MHMGHPCLGSADVDLLRCPGLTGEQGVCPRGCRKLGFRVTFRSGSSVTQLCACGARRRADISVSCSKKICRQGEPSHKMACQAVV